MIFMVSHRDIFHGTSIDPTFMCWSCFRSSAKTPLTLGEWIPLRSQLPPIYFQIGKTHGLFLKNDLRSYVLKSSRRVMLITRNWSTLWMSSNVMLEDEAAFSDQWFSQRTKPSCTLGIFPARHIWWDRCGEFSRICQTSMSPQTREKSRNLSWQ